jgi:NADH:ubiquinone oxidoreductase subunit E
MDIWNANELVNDEAIENLTQEQIDQLLEILKNI